MDKQDEAIHNIIKVYLAQMDSAVHISKILCEHSEDDNNILTGDHIICGLIYRLMVPMTDDHMTESLNNADNILNGLDESGSDESDESDESGEEDNSLEHTEPDKKRKLKMNDCSCDICSKCRECVTGYEAYETYDPMVTRFKDSIKETCEKHNIYIN